MFEADTGVSAESIMGIFDDPHYSSLAQRRAASYAAADPFPHTVIDDFLPEPVARTLTNAFPGREDMAWIEHDNDDNRRRFQTDETMMSPLFRSICREFNSRQFLLFLETMTGLDNLLSDPYLIGGGVHLSERGEFLNIHADFNWHHKLQAFRRCNALLYLNEEWDPQWGGATEFWARDMSERVVSVQPVFNRLLVFNTGETSNHGQPEPNACPPDVTRKVLNFYYYTTHRNDEDAAALPHFTMYKIEASPRSLELGERYRASGAGLAEPAE